MDENLVTWLHESFRWGEALIVWSHPETPLPFSDELKAKMATLKMEFRINTYLARGTVLFQIKDVP